MAVTSLRGELTERLSFGRLAAINAFWFGGGAHWQPIYISLIPVGATLIAGTNADLLIGRVTAAGGIFALLTPILVGCGQITDLAGKPSSERSRVAFCAEAARVALADSGA